MTRVERAVGGLFPRNDVLLALALTALTVLEIAVNTGIEPKWAAVVTEVPMALALAGRRRFPLATVLFVSGATVAGVLLGIPIDQPIVPLLVFVVAVYSLAAHAGLRDALLGLAAIVAVSVIGGIDQSGSTRERLGNVVFGIVVVGGVWVAGRIVRSRNLRAASLLAETKRLEGERLAAIEDERARIARELHDVIAHSLSVMVVQAVAARQVLGKSPDQAERAMHTVEDVGRQALVEMSRVVGLLRDDHDELGLAPQPGLADLDALVGHVGEAGLPVELEIEGEPRAVPLGVDLSAYRVVQEALTNTLKHAGPAHAWVRLAYRPDALEVEVVDDGAGDAGGHSGGHGLAGMRERVSVFGGELEAGPLREGGFRIRALLPTGAAGA